MGKVFLILPNLFGFVPFGGDIKNLWLLFLLKSRKSRINRRNILGILLVVGLNALAAIRGFEIKYFLTAILPFLLLKYIKADDNFNDKLRELIFKLSVFFISLMPFYFLKISSLDKLFELIFGVGSGFDAQGGRGAAFFANEPSHMALYLLLFISVIRGARGRRKLTLIFACFMMITTAASGSMFLYLAVYIAVSFFASVLKLNIFKFTAFLFLSLAILVIYNLGLLPDRIYDLMYGVSFVLSQLKDFEIVMTAKLASGRFIANYLWITDLVNHPLGHGFSLSRDYIVLWAKENSISLNQIGAYKFRGEAGLPIMPRSYLTAITAIYGIFGPIIFLYAVRLYVVNYKIRNFPLFLTSVFYLVVVGLPGNPLPWLLITLSLEKRKMI